MKQYYQVGAKVFAQPYAALRESALSGQFAEYIVPEDYKQSFLGINPCELPDNKTLMLQKAEYLNKNYNCRFHYSGGVDSHSVIDLTDWPMHYMYLRGLIDVKHVDEEYMFGYDYLVERDLPKQIRYIALEEYEVWKDPEAPYKYSDFYYGVSPSWLSGYDIAESSKYDLEITAYEKPLLYAKDKNYYWLLHDGTDIMMDANRVDFFLDDYFPELAVKQVYTYYNYFCKYQPNQQGFLNWRSTDQYKLLEPMGRDLNRPPQPVVKTLTDWDSEYTFNYKQQRTFDELVSLGCTDIIDAWIATGENLINTLQSASHGIEVVTRLVNGYGEIRIPTRINRIGAIYKLHDTELELLDHTDISKL
mgnify:CR=1 FL=1